MTCGERDRDRLQEQINQADEIARAYYAAKEYEEPEVYETNEPQEGPEQIARW